MHDLTALLDLAKNLAVSAGDILIEGRRSGFGTIDTKSSSVDIVTEIDRASESHIVAGIRSARPDDAILGEEGTTVAGTSGVRWVIDPLDGTVNFTYGLAAFSVSIGAEIDGGPAIGAVYNPSTGELFTAVEGGGAFLNGEAIRVSDRASLELALVGTGFSYSKQERATNALVLASVLPDVRDIRRMGSAALDLCMVACGRLDGYFEMQVQPWDVCAGTVIAREAGATVTSLDGLTPNPQRNVIAAPSGLHPELLTLIDKAVRNA